MGTTSRKKSVGYQARPSVPVPALPQFSNMSSMPRAFLRPPQSWRSMYGPAPSASRSALLSRVSALSLSGRKEDPIDHSPDSQDEHGHVGTPRSPCPLLFLELGQ